jgi:hypothetical protein
MFLKPEKDVVLGIFPKLSRDVPEGYSSKKVAL